jgi:hypothetical protein
MPPFAEGTKIRFHPLKPQTKLLGGVALEMIAGKPYLLCSRSLPGASRASSSKPTWLSAKSAGNASPRRSWRRSPGAREGQRGRRRLAPSEGGVGLPGGWRQPTPSRGAAQGALPLAALVSLLVPRRGEIRHFWRGSLLWRNTSSEPWPVHPGAARHRWVPELQNLDPAGRVKTSRFFHSGKSSMNKLWAGQRLASQPENLGLRS